jgi:hypothetical protein
VNACVDTDDTALPTRGTQVRDLGPPEIGAPGSHDRLPGTIAERVGRARCAGGERNAERTPPSYAHSMQRRDVEGQPRRFNEPCEAQPPSVQPMVMKKQRPSNAPVPRRHRPHVLEARRSSQIDSGARLHR